MQLLELYKRGFVGQMFPSRLRKILRGEHPTVYVRSTVNGVIIFSDGKVLKCVDNYYTLPGSRLTKSNTSQYLKCNKIRKAFGLSDYVAANDCVRCHLACYQAENDGEIKRKPLRKKQ